MIVVRIVLYLALGYVLGLALGQCALSDAREQSRSLPAVIHANLALGHSQVTPVLRTVHDKTKFKIVIIDTGYNPVLSSTPLKLCKSGHYDFYTDRPVLAYTASHGTMVASLIAEALEDVDYCAIIYQVVDSSGEITVESERRALIMASKINATAVNLSLGGNISAFEERATLLDITKHGTKVFAAAGNSRADMDKACNFFPACYGVPGMYVVGALTPDLTQPASYSNYGTKVDLWYDGTYQTRFVHAEGSSFAAPRALGSYVSSLSKH